MSAIVYTKRVCPYCVSAKKLLESKGITYSETVIGEDILREDFIAMFPTQKTVPLIFINEQRIGGYDDLVEYFRSDSGDTARFLAEGS